MKLYFIGEGRTDIGDAVEPAAIGAVAVLVRRILREVAKRDGLDFQRRMKRLSHLHGKRSLQDKVFQAIKDADTLGYDGVVIVVDRDHERYKDRIKSLKEGRERARTTGIPIPAAVGLAIEEMEAWLLADEKAISDALGGNVPPTQPDPESMADPKAALARLIGESDWQGTVAEALESISELVNLDVLRRRCKAGFSAFDSEVRTEIAGRLL